MGFYKTLYLSRINAVFELSILAVFWGPFLRVTSPIESIIFSSEKSYLLLKLKCPHRITEPLRAETEVQMLLVKEGIKNLNSEDSRSFTLSFAIFHQFVNYANVCLIAALAQKLNSMKHLCRLLINAYSGFQACRSRLYQLGSVTTDILYA
jgi:hypothetical protein